MTPWTCSLPGSSAHGISPGKNTGVGLPFPSPGDLPNPGIERRSPSLQADSLPSKPPGKPKFPVKEHLLFPILRMYHHAVKKKILYTDLSSILKF